MARVTVGSAASSQHLNHLHAESIPVVDLRLLSQSELLSLSLCSSSASSSSLRHLHDDAEVFTPKIDRSVFNESAGSRKQTFSRLRLAPRNTSQFAQSPSNYRLTPPIAAAQSAEQYLDEENSQIISLLKSLFGVDSSANTEENENDSNLVSVPVQFQDYQQNAPVGVVYSSGGAEFEPAVSINTADSISGKRKRGRPRKNQNNVSSGDAINQAIGSEDKETECKMVENVERGNKEGEEMAIVNKNGMAADLAALQNAVNAYEEELTRRTEGLRTETEFLGFLEGLEGQWMSNRKKRRIVDASTFGNALPIRWKLVLCLQRRSVHFWLSISRYISPNGQQFMSCKDVLSYLLSFRDLQGEHREKCDHFDDGKRLTNKMASGNTTGLTIRGNVDGAILSSMFPSTSTSAEHEKLSSSLMTSSLSDVHIDKKYRCHKCTLAFDEEDNFLQHLVFFHQRAPKRLRSGTPMTEEVIIKNQKYECQICHRTFEERHCYNGHLGNHIKDYLKRVEASVGVNRAMPASARAHSEISDTQESIGIEKDSIAIASIIKTSDKTCSAGTLCEKKESAADGTYSVLQNRVCNISIHRLEKTNEITDAVATESMFGSGTESALLDIKNNTMLKSSNETDSFNSTAYGVSNFDSQDKILQNNSLASPRRVQACIVDNNLDHIGDQNIEDMPMSGAIEDMKIDNGDSVVEDDPIMGLGNYSNFQEAAVTSIAEDFSVFGSVNKKNQPINFMERDSKEASFSSVDEKSFVLSNNLDTVSTIVVNECNFDEIAESGVTEQTAGVGRVSPAPIENITGSYGTFLANPYFKEKTDLVDNGVDGNIDFTMEKTYQQKSESIQHTLFDGEDLLCLSGTKQVKVVEDHRHFACTFQEEPESKDLGSSRSNELMIGFDRHDQPKETVSPNFMWSTDGENHMLLDCAHSSSLPVQSPDNLPACDLVSGKDEDEFLCGRITSVSDTEKLSLGSMGNMECNLLTSQTSSYSDNSKVFSYDAEVAQGFDSSIQREKGILPLLPTEKNSCFATTVCASCRTEFYHETSEIQIQRGSMSFICAVCQAKLFEN